jgi:hypothetical protein
MSGHAGNGGIQRHSVGKDYPFTVVGTIRDGETRYYIVNLVTGEEHVKDSPFYGSRVAHSFAHFLKELS